MAHAKIETTTYTIEMISYTKNNVYSVSVYNKHTDHMDNFYGCNPLDFVSLAFSIHYTGDKAVEYFLSKAQ